MNEDKKRTDIALFKYALIAPVIQRKFPPKKLKKPYITSSLTL